LWKLYIPISQIKAISYESRTITYVLVIHYLKNDKERKTEFNVEYFIPDTLSAINHSMLSVNPSIGVNVDDQSKKQQEIYQA